jgi:hypothetical protein
MHVSVLKFFILLINIFSNKLHVINFNVISDSDKNNDDGHLIKLLFL